MHPSVRLDVNMAQLFGYFNVVSVTQDRCGAGTCLDNWSWDFMDACSLVSKNAADTPFPGIIPQALQL